MLPAAVGVRLRFARRAGASAALSKVRELTRRRSPPRGGPSHQAACRLRPFRGFSHDLVPSPSACGGENGASAGFSPEIDPRGSEAVTTSTFLGEASAGRRGWVAPSGSVSDRLRVAESTLV